jgi:Arc/MetJ-type ribon-helix-helix transcriptional regulator
MLYCNKNYYSNFMRNIINISLPEQMVKEVKRDIKQENYASVSEYFRDLLRLKSQMRKSSPQTIHIPKLSANEQQLLKGARKKIAAINDDVLNSTGLTQKEANIAAKAGFINTDQKYWWLESWQKRHRQAEQDDREGRYEEFDSAEAFLNSLPS